MSVSDEFRAGYKHAVEVGKQATAIEEQTFESILQNILGIKGVLRGKVTRGIHLSLVVTPEYDVEELEKAKDALRHYFPEQSFIVETISAEN